MGGEKVQGASGQQIRAETEWDEHDAERHDCSSREGNVNRPTDRSAVDPSNFTASMEHRMFFGSRSISRLTSYVLSASTLSSYAMISSASSIGTSANEARLRRRKSISL